MVGIARDDQPGPLAQTAMQNRRGPHDARPDLRLVQGFDTADLKDAMALLEELDRGKIRAMTCSKCAAESPGDALFCQQCGAKIERACPSCGAAVSPDARFCKRCGQGLGSQTPIAAVPKTTPHAGVRVVPDQPASTVIEGERKTVTALFADIKGSMELMAELDPEEARAIAPFPALARPPSAIAPLTLMVRGCFKALCNGGEGGAISSSAFSGGIPG